MIPINCRACDYVGLAYDVGIQVAKAFCPQCGAVNFEERIRD